MFITAPVPPAVPITPIVCKMISLLLTPVGKAPSTCILMFLLRFVISLCGQDTLDFTRPDSEGKGPKGTISRRVAVSAHCSSGKSEALAGPIMRTMP